MDSNSLGTFLRSFGLILAAPPSAVSPGHFNVFVEVQRSPLNKQMPSNFELNNIRDQLSARGVTIDFLLLDGRMYDIEAGIRATLLHSFGSVLRNAFLSATGRKASLWLDPKKEFDSEIQNRIREKSELFLAEVGFQLQGIASTADQNLPTKTVILKAIRLNAPILLETLGELLRANEFSVPSADWLARKLDALRKSRNVIRLSDGKYALTYESIIALGSAKGASSPDVRRLLALNRRTS